MTKPMDRASLYTGMMTSMMGESDKVIAIGNGCENTNCFGIPEDVLFNPWKTVSSGIINGLLLGIGLLHPYHRHGHVRVKRTAEHGILRAGRIFFDF